MFTYKKLSLNDLNTLSELSNDVYNKMPRKEFWGGLTRDDFITLLTEPNFILGAFVNDLLVGFMCLYNPKDEDMIHYNLSNYDKSEIGFLHGVMVRCEFQGNGLQLKMSNIIEKLSNTKYLFATVHPENMASLKSLTRFGMEIIDTKNLSYGYRHLMIKKTF